MLQRVLRLHSIVLDLCVTFIRAGKPAAAVPCPCRLLKLLDDHWEAYSQHLTATPAAAAASLRTLAYIPEHSSTLGAAVGTPSAATSVLARPRLQSSLRQLMPTAASFGQQPSTPLPLAWVTPVAARTAARTPRVLATPAAATPAAAAAAAKGQAAAGSCVEVLPSSFTQLLRTMPLPCVYKSSAAALTGDAALRSHAAFQQQQKQQDDEQQDLLLLLPRQQLVLSQHLLSFFGSFKLPYLAADVTEPQLLQLIGVTSEVSVQVVLQALVQLATGQQLQLQPPGYTEQDQQQLQLQQQQRGALLGPMPDAQQQQWPFVGSCKVMAGLYSYLLQQLQLAQQQAQTAAAAATNTQQQQQHVVHYQQLQQQVQAAFQQYPLVWLPDASADAAAGSTDGCPGRFHHLRQLCLDDPSGVLEQLACQQLAAAAGQQQQPNEVIQADTGAGAAVRPVALLRPVLLHYAGAGQLFSEWLAAAPAAAAAHHDAASAAGTAVSTAAASAASIKGCMLWEPAVEHYIAALQLLAAEAAERQQQGLPDAHLGRDSAIWTQVSCVYIYGHVAAVYIEALLHSHGITCGMHSV
jgi:hypothetical protein